MQEKLLRYMIDSEIIDPEDQVIYRYGMQQLKGSLISIGTTLLIGILFHAVWASICFAAAFIPLRKTQFRKKTVLILLAENLLMAAGYGMGWSIVTASIFMGIVCTAILILAAKKPDRIARRKRRWKKTERVSGRKRSAGC